MYLFEHFLKMNDVINQSPNIFLSKAQTYHYNCNCFYNFIIIIIENSLHSQKPRRKNLIDIIRDKNLVKQKETEKNCESNQRRQSQRAGPQGSCAAEDC